MYQPQSWILKHHCQLTSPQYINSDLIYFERRICSLDLVVLIQLEKLLLWHGDNGAAA